MQDNEALQVREAKKAAQRAKDAKKQHGPPALPAPYLAAAPVKKAGHLNGKDKELLHIAEKEMKADNTKVPPSSFPTPRPLPRPPPRSTSSAPPGASLRAVLDGVDVRRG